MALSFRNSRTFNVLFDTWQTYDSRDKVGKAIASEEHRGFDRIYRVK